MHIVSYLEMVTSYFLTLPSLSLGPGTTIYVFLGSFGQRRWQFALVFRQQFTLQRARKQLGIEALW